jgi:hypothetical protein
LQQLKGDAVGARDHFDGCCEIRASLARDANTSRKRQYLLALARCGECDKAEKLFDEIVQTHPQADIELLLDLARAATQCSVAAADATLAEKFRAQALERIRQCLDAGYRDPAYLEYEPDFMPLKSENRFLDLVSQVRRLISDGTGP